VVAVRCGGKLAPRWGVARMTESRRSDRRRHLEDVARAILFTWLVVRLVAGKDPAEKFRREWEDAYYAAFGRAYLNADDYRAPRASFAQLVRDAQERDA
jgi:hypothetical protein